MKKIFIYLSVVVYFIVNVKRSISYPIFAQQNYNNPREANGRIVCANCHLAQKTVEISIPQAVLPNTVFDRLVNIPYDTKVKQVLGNGKTGEINVGAVIIIPKGFQIAPTERINRKQKGSIYFQPYSAEKNNIIVVGPIPGKSNQEIAFPILSPTQDFNFLKFPVYVGGNRGRGQVYPDGSKSNNNVYTSSVTGVVREIQNKEKKGGYQVFLETQGGNLVKEEIPPGPQLLIKEGDFVKVDAPLTNNPNVGGFGQAEGEIVLQDPQRVQALIAFFFAVLVTQICLVLKKKQFEKIQLASINFLCLLFLPILLF